MTKHEYYKLERKEARLAGLEKLAEIAGAGEAKRLIRQIRDRIWKRLGVIPLDARGQPTKP